MLEIFAVGHFCRIYLHDFYPKMAPTVKKELVTSIVNHEDVFILPNGNTLKSAGKYPYL